MNFYSLKSVNLTELACFVCSQAIILIYFQHNLGGNMKKHTLLIAIMIIAGLGCSTIKGIGEDIRGLGSGIAGASDKVRSGMEKK